MPGRASSVSRLRQPGHVKTRRIWSAACFAVIILVCFARPLFELVIYAAGNDLYSYIFLVPLISGYLLYSRRARLPKTYAVDAQLAILFLAAGVGLVAILFWLNLTREPPTENDRLTVLTLSFLCCLAAGGFFFVGRTWMRAAAFPIAYLIFMVPMPNAMADALETASKYASAEAANLLFHLSGTPFVREGLVFQLPNITIEVAQECSGIRSTFILFITSVLAANLFLNTQWRRFALVAFVIPLAILRNGFRIAVIGLLCVNIGPQMIHSVIHRRGGPVFFVLALVPFFVGLWVLRKGDRQSRQSG
jgi:exosortase C (VPDSG-CTERM-specific)